MSATSSRMNRWGSDTGLSIRMFIVMFLLAALYLGFIAFMIAAGVQFFVIMIIAVLLLGAQYFFSDKIALWSMGAKEVSAQEAPELHAMIERLVAIADLPKPKIAIADTDVPNAFATGRNPSNAAVAVTRGLMQQLNQSELEAVIAHELAHIRNRDVMIMTLASFFAVVAQMLMRMFFWGSMFGGHRRNNQGGAIILVYLVSILVWVISYFLIRALSRYREFSADRGAALLTGAPENLVSALMKISGVIQRIPQQDLREVQDMNAFFIIPAVSGGGLSELFSTHPPMEKRIQRLQDLAREMEGM